MSDFIYCKRCDAHTSIDDASFEYTMSDEEKKLLTEEGVTDFWDGVCMDCIMSLGE